MLRSHFSFVLIPLVVSFDPGDSACAGSRPLHGQLMRF